MEFYAHHSSQVTTMTFLTGAFKGVKGTEHTQTKYEIHMEPLCQMVDRNPAIAGSLLESLKMLLAGKKETFTHDDPKQGVSEVLSLISKRLKPLVIEPFLNETSVVCYARQLLDFWSHDVSHLTSKIHVPTLFLTGEHDQIASSQVQR
jgi:hypothetical protein